MEQNQFSSGNPLLDVIILLGIGGGLGWMAKRKSPEQVLMQEKEKVRQHELEVAQTEALKVQSANQSTVAMMAQKHDSYRKAAESMAKSFHNGNVDACDAQAAMAALAKNFGIIS